MYLYSFANRHQTRRDKKKTDENSISFFRLVESQKLHCKLYSRAKSTHARVGTDEIVCECGSGGGGIEHEPFGVFIAIDKYLPEL